MVHICLCRFQCRRNSIAILLQLVYSGFLDTSQINPNSLYCKFYTCRYFPTTISGWGDIFQKQDETSLHKSTAMEFSQGETRKIILELVIGSDDDITEIQYLLLVLQKILSDGYDCTVLTSAGKHEENRYTPITNDNYFRLAQNLYFYRDNDDLDCCLAEIYRCFLVYCQIDMDGNSAKWIPLPRKYTKDQLFGRIIPQIPITHHSYYALTTSYSHNTSKNDWLSLLHDLCSGYFERLSDGVLQAQCEKIRTYQNSDSYFETLLFLGVCNNISKQDVDDPCFDIESLHEDCMNFAQGVLQLVENVVHHVLGEEDPRGCGILTIRHRKVEDARRLYLKEDVPSSNAKYFMELYLTDLQYGKFSGIIDKFKSNVEQRRDSSKDPRQRLVHTKFCISQNLENSFELIQKEDKGIQGELKDYQNRLEKEPNCCLLSLSDFFGQGTCQPFIDYISTPENVAFHYGLPILNSVVSSMGGYLHVQSGTGHTNRFDNRSAGGSFVSLDSFSWEYGTSYIIYIPLKFRSPAGDSDYLDLISWPHNADSSYRCHNFHLLHRIPSDYSREQSVLALREQIGHCFAISPSSAEAEQKIDIGVIDCASLVDGLCLDRLESYEVMIKAIFLYLADRASAIDNLALINIACPYDVIKLFRLFALFFDRVGKNHLLTQKKSFFLVDCDGKLDILFYGNELQSIRKSISVSCLYGGMTDTALKITTQLLEGRHG